MEVKIFIQVYKTAYTSGLVKVLGPQLWTTLEAIAIHMNKKGIAFPSQESLAEMLGISRQQVNSRVKALLEFRLDGKPIMTATKRKGARGHKNIYEIQPIAQVAIFDSQIEQIEKSSRLDNQNDGGLDTNYKQTNNNHLTINNMQEVVDVITEIKSPQDVIKYFCSKYRHKYNVNYHVSNWARETKMVKTKLWDTYSPSQLQRIIDIVFIEYPKWASRDYPRPTLGQLYTWLPNKCLALADIEEESKEQLQERIEQAENDADNFEAMMARLNRGRE